MILPLIVGFFTIALVFIALTGIASITGVAVIDLIFGAVFIIVMAMVLIITSIEIGQLILGT
jgi:hypothetical protein